MNENGEILPEDFYFSVQDAKEDDVKLNNFDLEEAEKILIIKAVGKYNGNLTKAAKELGLTRASLYRRLEKYGL